MNKTDKPVEDNLTKEKNRVHSVNVPSLVKPSNGTGISQWSHDNQSKNPNMASLTTINSHNPQNLNIAPHSFSNTTIPINGSPNQNGVISPDKAPDRTRPNFYQNSATLQV